MKVLRLSTGSDTLLLSEACSCAIATHERAEPDSLPVDSEWIPHKSSISLSVSFIWILTSCGRLPESINVGLLPVYSTTCPFLHLITENFEPLDTIYLPFANFSNQSALLEYHSSKALFNWISGSIHAGEYKSPLFLSGWYANNGNWSSSVISSLIIICPTLVIILTFTF
jgi:hypothetical protein